VLSKIGHRTPNVDAYHHVAADMGYRLDKIMFVDDSEENVAGAIASGMNACWVRCEIDVVRILDELMDEI
jgi:HAD superfamily hydrolase (TIGR01509 family)